MHQYLPSKTIEHSPTVPRTLDNVYEEVSG